ncbi:MAG TPA: hypothetical protein PKE40_00480 [Arachnia sp.]|nr:hypothetical protein [Arachnia sp.]HMT84801.1 hypothetical protein [Arachnia sp.]
MTSRPRRILGAFLAGIAITATLAACTSPIEETAQAAENQATSSTSSSASSSASTEVATSETTETTNDATTETEADSSSAYADGEYTASGSYTTPGGRESVTVTVTLVDDVVTALTVDGSAERGDSLRYQSEFIENIASEVVGVAIDDLDVSKVAGSSLTSGGFNDAISRIAAEAQA